MKIALVAIMVTLYLTVSVTAVFAAADLIFDDSVTPNPLPTGPQFEVTGLTIAGEPKLGDRVPLTVTVRNVDDQAGGFFIELRVSWLSLTIINTIHNLEAQVSTDSLFNLVGPERPGIYTARAGDLTLTFEVVE
jgi:hypothetical protein